MSRLSCWINKKMESAHGQVMSCAACHYVTSSVSPHLPSFDFRFDGGSRTVWRKCPRCGYQWDTGKGPGK